MDSLDVDFHTVLLTRQVAPCLSLYQPTHRRHPDNRQDPIRFRNLVTALETSLRRKYTARDNGPLLSPFHRLANDPEFWNHTLEGLAVLATPAMFKVYRLQRSVAELAVVADSLHIKPLIRIQQSADRYQILAINRHRMRLFEGNRDTLDEIEPAPEVPRTLSDAVGRESDDPERKTRTYGRAAPGAVTRHGTDVRQDALDNDMERFFRAVDRAVLDHHSRPTRMPLFLAALPEHHHLFRTVSQNPQLAAEAIDIHPDDLSLENLRERAWRLVLPSYLQRLARLVDTFGTARSNGLAADNLAQIGKAVVGGRVATLLIEADREIPGVFDGATGAVTFAELGDPDVDDLLDDLAEQVLRSGGEVTVVPAERMPTQTGIAAIYRF